MISVCGKALSGRLKGEADTIKKSPANTLLTDI
jgi:hypothetical protein